MSDLTYSLACSDLEPVEEILEQFLPASQDGPLAEAMRYSTLNGGKRIRAKLVINSSIAGPYRPKGLLRRLSAGIEFLHAFSLIHDDLPAMDDDPIRRGSQSCHQKFGEDVAILAGNSLMSKAFEIVTNLSFPDRDDSIICPMDIFTSLTAHDSVSTGQYVDLHSNSAELTMDEIIRSYELKTGLLIGASIQLGYLAGGVEPSVAKKMDQIGTRLGFPYQVINDCREKSHYMSVELSERGGEQFTDSLSFSKIGRIASIERGLAIIDKQKEKLCNISQDTTSVENFIAYLEDKLNYCNTKTQEDWVGKQRQIG